MPLFYLLFGAAFGFVLSRSGATDYEVVQRMFLFQDPQLYGIIGTAVAVIAPGLWLLKRRGRALGGQPLRVPTKPRHRGNVLGGLLFGIGWSLTGMCPGPVLVNLGEGKIYAWAAFGGVLVGTTLFGVLYPRLQAPLGLPPLAPPPS
ncbi:MAG: YeeE/YedE thiosulfate transporter family protein [Myxococcota bacterium]|jgi:hypothetical protein|nr:YeeE/YedE thiosulfate transporter family protein [Myxococcota bacterium]